MRFRVTALVAALAVVLALSTGCRRRPADQDQWGQSYQAQGQTYQADHGFFYYWFLYHVFFAPRVQPTYHIVQPVIVQRAAPSATASSPSMTKPATTAGSSFRSSGGFSSSTPPAASGFRSSGGFGSSSSSSGGFRSSGGFSSGRTGGFSSGSGGFRSGGGFGGRR